MAPILPHTAEQIYQQSKIKKQHSVFETGWFDIPKEWSNEETVNNVLPVIQIRDSINKIAEKLRNAKVIKTTDELNVIITKDLLIAKDELIQAWGVADVLINHVNDAQIDGIDCADESNGVRLSLVKSAKHKCPRCWRYDSAQELELCARCEPIVSKIQAV
jgi:isoleucyl-tRNA synthetase